ncbi:MAG: peptidase domain-containing ABC transporter [Muribaculaceae bacterium]|nr:peptidase domain-containing ABC transporter [Muribaculaceae bacterium]
MRLKYHPQRDMMDCGAACLQSICKYYGKEVDLQYIRELCHITRNGVSMLGIADAAESLGFKTIGIKLNLEQLAKDVHLPCIIHWSQQHFVVVISVTKRHVTIMDPAAGILKYKTAEFQKSWLHLREKDSDENLGAALLLSPTPAFYDKEFKATSSLKFSHFVKLMVPYKSVTWKIILCMLLGCVFSLIFPYLTQQIVDVGISNSDLSFISLILLAELALLMGQIINNIIRSRLMLTITSGISIGLISNFLGKLMRLPITFFDTKHIGDILQRIKDFNRIESFLTSTLLSLVLATIVFLVYGVMILSYSLKILSIFVVGSVVYVCWVSMFLKKRRKLDYMQFQYLSSNQSTMIQLVNGMQDIKLNSCERTKRWEWERLQNQIVRLRRYSLNLSNIQTAGSSMIDQAKNLIIVFFAAEGVISGRISIGELVAIQYIIGQLNAPLHQFVSSMQEFQDAKISMERMQEVETVPEEEKQFDHVDNPQLDNCDIHFKNVTFHYDGPRSPKVLDDINFKIENKKVTAIVGMSGCGKTTLLKILLSFFPTNSGSVVVGTTPLNNISPKEWRGKCGVVMQDGFIFSDTIERNIALSDGEIDRERVISAAKSANIHDYIMSLPMKYNTRIGAEGQGLSSGQKQRLLIARAIYKNPAFIIFDEATNALDAKNERAIVENLNEFYKGRTVVIVAHRLSTVKNADQIIVLDKGRVIEIGTHTSLIDKKGAYYNLVKNQLELGA